MTKLVVIATLCAVAACRDPGTMRIHITPPCTAEPEQVAVYLVRGTCNTTIDCGLTMFRCDGDHTTCVDLCNGYCPAAALDDLSVVPPDAETAWSLILSYRYPNAAGDQGLLCYNLRVVPDDESTTEVSLHTDDGDMDVCCMGSGS